MSKAAPVPTQAAELRKTRTGSPAPRRNVTQELSAEQPKTGKQERVAAAAEPSTGRPSRRVEARSIQCYLLLGTRLFQQSMRSALSPLLVFMTNEIQISTVQKGTLLSAIAAGYFFTQVPGGALADHLGAKNVMTCALALSALCCIAIPISVDVLGVPGLWVTMALMGAVQGPLFPTSTVFLSKWMPRKLPGRTDEKAWGTSMLDIGISVGALMIIPVANGLAGSLGWRNAYYIIGGLSLGFVALWQVAAAEEPKRCSFISSEELKFLEENVPKPSAKPQGTSKEGSGESISPLGVPLRVATHSGLWAVFVAHIAFNYGAYYLTNWSPTYYNEVLKISPSEAKIHLMLPHVTNLASKSLNPALVALAERRGCSLSFSRKIFTSAGFLLAAAALLPVHQLRFQSPWVSTVLFSLANAFFGLAPSGFKANYLDITEKYVGVISGYGNTLGTVASWVGPQLVAFLLQQTESWDMVLLSVALVNSLAALNYVLFAVVTPIEHDVEGKKVQ